MSGEVCEIFGRCLGGGIVGGAMDALEVVEPELAGFGPQELRDAREKCRGGYASHRFRGVPGKLVHLSVEGAEVGRMTNIL